MTKRIAPCALTAPLVTTGLDPVVHAAFERAQSCQKYFDAGVSMDCRVKPGNDEENGPGMTNPHPASRNRSAFGSKRERKISASIGSAKQ
jgi:hypothetical protein